MIEIGRELKKSIKTGKVIIGSRRTKKAVEKEEAKLVILSSNCPEEIRKGMKKAFDDEIVFEYPGSSLSLGIACGKPFPIASLCIIDPGESEILKVLKKES